MILNVKLEVPKELVDNGGPRLYPRNLRTYFRFQTLRPQLIMRATLILYFVIGIVIGYQIPNFFRYLFQVNQDNQYTAVTGDFDEHISNFVCSFKPISEDESQILLNIPISLNKAYLREAYEPNCNQYNVKFHQRNGTSNKSKEKINILEILLSIKNENLHEKYEYFVFLNWEMYVLMDEFSRFLTEGEFARNESMFAFYEGSPKDGFIDHKISLEKYMLKPLVVINQHLLLEILESGCSLHSSSSFWDCVTQSVIIEDTCAISLSPYVQRRCTIESYYHSEFWKSWCEKRPLGNDFIERHVIQKVALISFLESRSYNISKDIQYFRNVIEPSSKSIGITNIYDRKNDWHYVENGEMCITDHWVPKRKIDSIRRKEFLKIKQTKEKRKMSRRDNFLKMVGYTRSQTASAFEYIFLGYKSSYYAKISYLSLDVREIQTPESMSKIEINKLKKVTNLDIKNGKYKTSSFGFSEETYFNNQDRMALVVPFCCRLDTLHRFLINLQTVVSDTNDYVHLILVAYEDQAKPNGAMRVIQDFFRINATFSILLVQQFEAFQRGPARQLGASFAKENDLILFTDVDMTFNAETFHRIRWVTIQRKQIYYPIVYSRVKYHFNWTETHDLFEIDDYTGLWRNFGYGMLGIYKSDFSLSKGYSKTIKGWGEEDIDFADTLAKMRKFHIFRAPDPSFIHIYHEKTCSRRELGKKYPSCLRIQQYHLTSFRSLIPYLLYHKEVLLKIHNRKTAGARERTSFGI